MVNPFPPAVTRAALAAAALIAAAPAVGAGEVLRVTGTGSALGTMARVARAFERANPGVQVHLLPSLGSAGAVKAVAAGALDLGLAGRALRPEEQGLGVRAVEIARTPFLFVAGPRAGVTGLTAAELTRIYRGEQATWPGGERIRLVLRPAADVDTFLVRSLSPALAQAVDAALDRPGMLMAATNQECDDLVARTPGGLGPSTLAQLRTEAHGLVPLTWEGVEPTLANLAAGRYTLWKPIFVVLPGSPTPAARRFLAYLGSAEGRRLLEEAGNLPVPFRPGG